MRLLVDTNVFLELILGQERSAEAQVLLASSQEHQLFATDFSLHSIGLYLFRRGRHHVFQQFLDDMVTLGGLTMIALPVGEMTSVITTAQRFNLDFDDAYQYAAAEKYNLTLVSLDSDFDRTERGRKTPEQVLAGA